MLGEGNQLKIRILDDFSHVNSEFPNDVKYSPISILTNSQLHSQEPKCHSKLMNASPQDRADNLDKTIDDYALNVVCPSLNISFDELSDPSLISTDYKPSIIVGRIAISSSKNEITQSHDPIVLKNTFIESSRRLGKGCCVRLDVSQCSSHMYLFSGQIVALRGRNVDGSCFQVLDQLYFQPKLNYTGGKYLFLCRVFFMKGMNYRLFRW